MIIEYFFDHLNSSEKKIVCKFLSRVVDYIEFLSSDFSSAELRIFKRCCKKFVCLVESRSRKETY